MPSAVGTALYSSLPVDVPMLAATLPQSIDIPHAGPHTSTNQMQDNLSLSAYNRKHILVLNVIKSINDRALTSFPHSRANILTYDGVWKAIPNWPI
jgi:hypothetical protein